MKVIVSGATGFIGQHLVSRLAEKNHDVITTSRNPDRFKTEPTSALTLLKWDPNNEPFPLKELNEADAVIHLAGENVASGRWNKKRKASIVESREIGTRHLVQSLNLCQSPKVLLSASAIGIYGDRDDEVLNEDSFQGTGFLATVCKKWEGEARKTDPRHRLVIVRTGIVLGSGGGALKKLLLPFRMGLGGHAGNGRQWMSWIHIDDLVNMMIWAVENSQIKGVYNAVAPDCKTNKDFSKTLAAVLHRPCLIPVPAFVLKLLFGDMSQIVLQSQRIIPDRTVKEGFRFKYSSLENALTQILGA